MKAQEDLRSEETAKKNSDSGTVPTAQKVPLQSDSNESDMEILFEEKVHGKMCRAE